MLGRPGASGLRGGLGSTWGGPRLPPAVPVHPEAPPGSWRPEEGAQRAASPTSALGDGGRVGVLPPSLLPVTDQPPAPWSVSIRVREQRGCTRGPRRGRVYRPLGPSPVRLVLSFHGDVVSEPTFTPRVNEKSPSKGEYRRGESPTKVKGRRGTRTVPLHEGSRVASSAPPQILCLRRPRRAAVLGPGRTSPKSAACCPPLPERLFLKNCGI